MNIIAIIQCRMNSKRYPGKMLAPFMGKPLLFHVVERIKNFNSRLKMILATSSDQADDPLELYAKSLGLKIFRGSPNNVVKRFSMSLKKIQCDAFFRVCGDSPLLSSSLFNEAVSIYKRNNHDIITNVFPRTFPPGMSVELIKTKTFLDSEKKITNKYDQEHVTTFFYKNSKNYKIFNIECAKPRNSQYKLAIDKKEDLQILNEWYLKNRNNYEKLFPILNK